MMVKPKIIIKFLVVGSSATLLHKTWHSENVLDGTDIVILTQILYMKYKVKERLPLE